MIKSRQAAGVRYVELNKHKRQRESERERERERESCFTYIYYRKMERRLESENWATEWIKRSRQKTKREERELYRWDEKSSMKGVGKKGRKLKRCLSSDIS